MFGEKTNDVLFVRLVCVFVSGVYVAFSHQMRVWDGKGRRDSAVAGLAGISFLNNLRWAYTVPNKHCDYTIHHPTSGTKSVVILLQTRNINILCFCMYSNMRRIQSVLFYTSTTSLYGTIISNMLFPENKNARRATMILCGIAGFCRGYFLCDL